MSKYAAYGRLDHNHRHTWLNNYDTLEEAQKEVRGVLSEWSVRLRCLFHWTDDWRYICGSTEAGYVVIVNGTDSSE